MSRHLYPSSSNPTTQFIEALAAASGTFTPPFVGSAIYSLPGLPPSGSRRFLIRAIEYVAVQNIGLEFDFFASATGLTNAVATDLFVSRYQFASVNGVQFNGTGLYRYYVDGLAIPYANAAANSGVGSPNIHLAIQNIDTVAKSADAAGALAITIWAEPLTSIQG